MSGGTKRCGTMVAVALAALGLFFAAPAALADDPRSLRTEAERLRAENEGLAAETQHALLELYSLETRLAGAERRLAVLGERAAEVEEETAAARATLRVARADLAEAERRLASRLQAIYVEEQTDPLAVLLGAESLDEALRALESLDAVAADDAATVRQVDTARQRTEASLARLAERRAELAALQKEAEATRGALADARAERTAYLASLQSRQAFNESRIDVLLGEAAAAEAKTAELAAAEPVSTESAPAPTALLDDETESAANPAPAPTPTQAAEPAPAPVSGKSLTVSSTGYCLRGTTATGMPVGWGTVAVDPAVIPLGTRMSVPGYGDGVAADTGGAIVGNRIDLWFPTCAQARSWGHKTVTIRLY